MTILVTGAIGRVGCQVTHQLTNRGADVHALVRDPSEADFPANASVMQGGMLGTESLRYAFVDVRTLFLLNAVAGDEFTQTLLVLNVAREFGAERVVYLSIMYAEHFVNVPHFTVKSDTGRMIEQMGFSATTLRPAYFMNNEYMVKDAIVNHGIYPMSIGSKGVAMIDTHDTAEVAVIELIHRDAAPGKLLIGTINPMGPDTLTGPELVSTWPEMLGRPVAYGGDDLSGFETSPINFLPKWMAYGMRLMVERYASDGMVPQAGDVKRLTRILGRLPGTYHDLAATFAR